MSPQRPPIRSVEAVDSSDCSYVPPFDVDRLASLRQERSCSELGIAIDWFALRKLRPHQKSLEILDSGPFRANPRFAMYGAAWRSKGAYVSYVKSDETLGLLTAAATGDRKAMWKLR